MNHHLQNLLDYIFPRECIGCGAERHDLCPACAQIINNFVAHTGVCVFCGSQALIHICPNCRERLRLHQLVIATFFKHEAIQTLIHAWKFKGLRALTEPIADMLTSAVQRQPIKIAHTVIVPMPMHWARKRLRGFNQSELLAVAVAKRLSLPVALNALSRRWSPQQSKTASAQERTENVRGVCFCKQSNTVSEKHILLLDDIITTGSTTADAARALKESGALSVSAAMFAKG